MMTQSGTRHDPVSNVDNIIVIARSARLILRIPTLQDIAPELELVKSTRGRFFNFPLPEVHVRTALVSYLDHWGKRGFGACTIECADTGAYLGGVGVRHPDPADEPKLMWHLAEAAEGRGIAYEAMTLLLPLVWEWTGYDSAVAEISPDNDRSIKLARRFGAQHDGHVTLPSHGHCEIWRFRPSTSKNVT
ncbi:MAG: GNAT family protein [Sulfitobacter sp.]